MKVIFVTHQYPPGFNTGTELYAKRLALKIRGHFGLDVRVFTFEPSYQSDRAAIRQETTVDDGVEVTRIWMWSGLLPNRPLAQFYNVMMAKEFGKYLRHHQPAAVHFFHTQHMGVALMEEAFLAGIPTVVNLMDFWFLCPTAQLLKRKSEANCDGPELMECLDCLANGDSDYVRLRQFALEGDGFEPPVDAVGIDIRSLAAATPMSQLIALQRRKDLMKEVLLRVDRVLAPSVALRDIFVAAGYPTDRFEIARYGVDPMPAYTFDRSSSTTLRLGFIGSINRPKGLHILIDALSGLEGDLTLDIHGNPAYFPEYAKMCFERASHDPRIRVRGAMSPQHAPTALRDIDALVVPSTWHENTPFVVLEARAAGVPVIGADVRGIAEVIDEGRTGRLFKAGDAASLRELLRELLADRAALARMTGHFAGVRTLLANAHDFARMYESFAKVPALVEVESTSGAE